jgi:dephospho-CoA kinase
MSEGLPLKIAVTGGIGSGKSVVCRVLKAMGYEVFDTDSEARRIMDSDRGIHERLTAEIDPLAVVGGRVDRGRISEVVFASAPKLEALNAIVHGAVRRELEAWFTARSGCATPVFVETAILYQSGLDRLVDRVWDIQAPEDLRVGRVIARNGLSEAAVRARIRAQAFAPARVPPSVTAFANDGVRPLLPQIEQALKSITQNSLI